VRRTISSLWPYLQLVRLPATFSACSNILAAHLIATGAQPHWWVLLLQLASGTALYWSGMVLNDCFDLDTDRRERPARPLPAGQVPLRVAWVLGCGLMLGGLGLAALAGGDSLRIAFVLCLAILTYDGLLKDTVMGPMAMGTCRYFNWMLGLSVVPLAEGAQFLAVPVFLYTAAVTVLSGSEASGADPRRTGLTAALLGATVLLFIILVIAGLLSEPLVLVPLALAIIPLAQGLHRLEKDRSPEVVQGMVRMLLFGMIPLDALLLLGTGHWLLAPSWLLLILPGRLLARRLAIT
jgi:4-hydroxybenzoate polyprenyltransferase